jgi:hypothetical protein
VAAVILGEPIGLNLMLGLATVAGGVWIASTEPAPAKRQDKKNRAGPKPCPKFLTFVPGARIGWGIDRELLRVVAVELPPTTWTARTGSFDRP